jgi:N-acetyl-anhydromuramyl-L-alanine amidase AmpD
VLQGAPLEDRTWHSGGSAWTSPEGTPRDDVNRRSIGIDLDNVGQLYLSPSSPVDSYEWARMHTATGETRPNYRRGPVREPRAFHRGPVFGDTQTARMWEAYTAAQMRAFLQLVVRLRDLYPQLADPRRWVGHEHIRGTKSDPGPAFPWPWVQAALQPGFTAETVDLIDWRPVSGVVE